LNNNWKHYIEQRKTELEYWENRLFHLPELGFKEIKTRAALIEYAGTLGLSVSRDFGINGFAITIGQGFPHIGLIAELDALVTKGHPAMAQIDEAAHSCGHHLQTTIMMETLGLWSKYRNRELDGSVTVYFIAAEEFVDLDYRLKLQGEGLIKLLSGKQNLLIENAFSDTDVLISCHTMGNSEKPAMELNSRLSGFIYKKIKFIGKSAHAAVAPHMGINALNAQVLTQTAIGLLRETFEEHNLIRVHLITTTGGQSVNAVPSETVLEGYVRAIDSKPLLEISNRIDSLAAHCALALSATTEITNRTGYMPLIQSEALSLVLQPYMEECVGSANIYNRRNSFAAGDVGDCSLFYPTVQFGFSGCQGIVHGADFCMKDSTEALMYPIYVIISSIEDLISHPQKVTEIKANFKPMLELSEYKKMHGIK